MNNWSSKEFLIFFIVLLKILTILALGGTDAVATAFIRNGIVPDLISRPPRDLLKVSFANNVIVQKGNELTPTQVRYQPAVEWRSSPNTYHTLMMLDADVPSRAEPTLRAVKHWLVTNIPGNQVNCGEVLDAFFGSAPQRNTGLHRYTLLIYKQPGKLVFDEARVGNNSIEGRTNFKADDFARKYRLKGPIAGNFYRAQWDETAQSTLEALGLS